MRRTKIFGSRSNKGPRALLQTALAAARRYSHINWALADQSLVSGCNFLTMILLARYLGIEEFGRFTLAWMVVLISVGLHGALVISPMMSIAPKQHKDDRSAYFGALVLQHLAIVALFFVLIAYGALACDWLFPTWRAAPLALPLACASFAYNTQEFLRRHFFSVRREARAFATDALRYPGQLFAIVILSQLKVIDVQSGLWVISASAVAGLFPCLPHLPRPRLSPEILRSTIVRHWNFSSWLILGTIINLASASIFFIVAGTVLGTAAVGALNATRTLLGVTRIVFFGLGNIAETRAARHFHQAGTAALTRYLGRLAILLLVLTGGIVIILAAAPEFWLRFAFGSEYAGFGYLVQWWAVIHLIIALDLPLRAGFFAIERTKAVFIASLLPMSFALASAYGLVTYLESIGVVVGSLITILVRSGTLAISLYGQMSRLRRSRSEGSEGS